jgi:hypothetical protein
MCDLFICGLNGHLGLVMPTAAYVIRASAAFDEPNHLQPTPSTGPPILTADSACTETYVSLSCPVLNKRLTQNPIKIKIPNGVTIESTHVAEIDLPMLRPAARKAHLSQPSTTAPCYRLASCVITRSQHIKCAGRR